MTRDKSWKLEVKSFGNLDQILTEFNGFEVFNTDTTEEKIVMTKFALWFCWEM